MFSEKVTTAPWTWRRFSAALKLFPFHSASFWSRKMKNWNTEATYLATTHTHFINALYSLSFRFSPDIYSFSTSISHTHLTSTHCTSEQLNPVVRHNPRVPLRSNCDDEVVMTSRKSIARCRNRQPAEAAPRSSHYESSNFWSAKKYKPSRL